MTNGRCGTSTCPNEGTLRRGLCDACGRYRRKTGDDPANRPGLRAKPQGRCRVARCTYDGPLTGDGYCDPCKLWARRHPGQDPAERERRQRGPADGECTVIREDGTKCPNKHDSHGFCPEHRARWEEYGDPLVVSRRPTGTLWTELLQAANATTDECMILTGYAQRPAIHLNGQTVNASRAVWVMAHGDPGDAWVLHTCHRGIEGCINVPHLYLGDHERNTLDMVEAVRQARGERNGYALLTEVQVRAIRLRYKPRHPLNGGRPLAAEFGAHTSTVADIVKRRTWAWVADS